MEFPKSLTVVLITLSLTGCLFGTNLKDPVNDFEKATTSLSQSIVSLADSNHIISKTDYILKNPDLIDKSGSLLELTKLSYEGEGELALLKKDIETIQEYAKILKQFQSGVADQQAVGSLFNSLAAGYEGLGNENTQNRVSLLETIVDKIQENASNKKLRYIIRDSDEAVGIISDYLKSTVQEVYFDSLAKNNSVAAFYFKELKSTKQSNNQALYLQLTESALDYGRKANLELDKRKQAASIVQSIDKFRKSHAALLSLSLIHI